ncbi:hypothetical protein Kpho01_31440 [Kitasatospora phosalacinea]|uniref:Uncharacterized protein n=1 Tax=Kitasatospora phosalacinea TaxID=2065 RepID=A0A9W6PHR7_9ACTN|nr:hypothetical protein Kpho01_31440 [Kitasatospora phosalacinea]
MSNAPQSGPNTSTGTYPPPPGALEPPRRQLLGSPGEADGGQFAGPHRTYAAVQFQELHGSLSRPLLPRALGRMDRQSPLPRINWAVTEGSWQQPEGPFRRRRALPG